MCESIQRVNPKKNMVCGTLCRSWLKPHLMSTPYSRLWHRMAHSKCDGFDSGVDLNPMPESALSHRGFGFGLWSRHVEVIVNSSIGSPTACFSLNTVSVADSEEKHRVWDDIPELTITSPFVQSRHQHIYHGRGDPLPKSTITLCQSRLYPPVRDFGFCLRLDSILDFPMHGFSQYSMCEQRVCVLRK
jgi:hypothetical protein